MTSVRGSGGPAELGSLYPFLYARGSAPRPDPHVVLAELGRSTTTKTDEIIALRRTVLERDRSRLVDCALDLADRFAAGGRLFTFGNGGSCTDAADLAGLFLNPGGDHRPLPAFSLTSDVAVLTALSNDVGFDVVFARPIAAVGRAGDIAVGLSTSGNSPNLVRAFDEASRRGMLTIGLSGDDGGRMAELGSIDHLFVVPSSSVHRIQEAQTTIYHALWEITLTQLSYLSYRSHHRNGHSSHSRSE